MVLQARGLAKVFGSGDSAVPVLNGIDLDLAAGERIAIIGASGSGKSTLLHLLGGLDDATAGSVAVMGRDLMSINQAARGMWRNQHVGFVYQFHHLLPEFSALEKVALPLLIRRVERSEALARAQAILGEFGLGHRLQHAPGELSGGERQRAAVARALVTSPACVLADEPTGNLDRQTAERVFEVMLEASAQRGTAFVIVTHDTGLAARADRRLRLQDGALAAEN
jgi:lipoprotein-releasing system ATP-binding protein